MKYAARLLIRVLVAGVGLSLGVQAQATRTIEFGGEVTVVVNSDVLDDTVAVGGRVRGTYTVATPGTGGVYDVVGWTLRVGNYLFTYTKNDSDTVITTLTLEDTGSRYEFSISTTPPVGDDDVHVVSSTDTEFAWPNAGLVLNVTVQTYNDVWNNFGSEGVSDTTGSTFPDQPFIDTEDELFAAADSSFSIGWRTDYLRNSSAMPVFIDVSPGTDLNSIPLDRGFIRVAIL
ncbi:MAG: hypothetical protein GTO67_17270, partial [Gammaproteobacteria bacterium]|nr:hypothetical protein [Gammaproteobacteria bacterium]NIM73615.1 hypothetical protein [Gammaproteobacteria bacterium]NIN40269.1 hypothetical protein [Gammaproteobacteria bacterium]NIO25432.1 hypothetical protein [Gammaproteobacteria bacterium]NIO66109.1 hypothetical protein [Gammaproteobacteria bacterium]